MAKWWTKLWSAREFPSLPIAPLESVDIMDREMEKRIVRKQDLRILPWICITYLLNYIDRVNLGNARVLNNDTDDPNDNIVNALNLTGNRYQVIVAVFFVPYILLEFPSNIALKYFSPSVWISRIMVSWGIVTMCTAAVTTYGGLLTVRIFLGIAEAGFFPGIMMYLCFWYKPDERATRMAIFACSVAVAGAFSGILATGISFMNGLAGLSGWQWLFLLEGIPTVLVGIAVWFYLPDFPPTAKWLTPEERAFAVKRLGPYAPSMNDKHWDSAVAKKVFIEAKFWIFTLQNLLMVVSINGFGYFAPTIITTLGFSGWQAQLLTVPPNVVGMIVILSNCVHSDYTKERSRHILAALAWVAIGFLILANVHDNVGARFFAVCMIACTNAAIIPFLAHISATMSGSTATALQMGGCIALGNTGGIIAPFLFSSAGAPLYELANWTIFGFLVFSMGITGVIWKVYGAHSNYRTGRRNSDGTVEVEVLEGEDADKHMTQSMALKMTKSTEERAHGKVEQVV